MSNSGCRISTNGSQKPLHEATVVEYRLKSRDNARTPLQWDTSTNAGFSTVTPWIDIHDDYQQWNAAAQIDDKKSTYSYWSNVLELRKKFADIFIYGSFDMVSNENPDIFAYTRSTTNGRALIVTNFRTKDVPWVPPPQAKEIIASENLVLSNYDSIPQSHAGNSITLPQLGAFVWVSDAVASSNVDPALLRN